MLAVTSNGCGNSYYGCKGGSQEEDKHRKFPRRQLLISSVKVSVDILKMQRFVCACDCLHRRVCNNT